MSGTLTAPTDTDLAPFLKTHPTVVLSDDGIVENLYKPIGIDGRPMREIDAERMNLSCNIDDKTIRRYDAERTVYTTGGYGISFGTAYWALVTHQTTPFRLWEGAARAKDLVNVSARKVYARRAILYAPLDLNELIKVVSVEAVTYQKNPWSTVTPSEWMLIERALRWLVATASPDREQIARRITKLVDLWEHDGWALADFDRIRIVGLRAGKELPPVQPVWDLAPDYHQLVLSAETTGKQPILPEIRRLIGGLCNAVPTVDYRCRKAIQQAIVSYLTVRVMADEATYKSWLNLIAEGALPVGVDADRRLIVAV